MAYSDPSEQLRNNLVPIILTTVSIIQGVAFGYLAEKLPRIIKEIPNEGLLYLAHFVLCLAVLLRFYQTYITAALGYSKWKMSFFDLLAIFFTGLCQYVMFEAIDSPPGFRPHTFYSTIALIALAAAIIHGRVCYFLPRQSDVDAEDCREVSNVQSVNLFVALLVLAIAVPLAVTKQCANYIYIVGAFFLCIAVSFNIYNSVCRTFYSNRTRT